MMRAVTVERTGDTITTSVQDVPTPACTPGTVRVGVRAIGVNFRDVHEADDGPEAGKDRGVLGTDFAGEVLEVGEGVTEVAVGDRVFGAVVEGAYAEEVLTIPAMLFSIPDEWSFATAAALPVSGLTASFALTDLHVTSGDTVVSYAAAGGLGCALGAVLSDAGVRSIGLVSSSEKAEIALAAGHAEVINYRQEDPVEAVRRLTGGVGAAGVVDSVCGPNFGQSFRMLRDGGTVLLCGHSAGDAPESAFREDFLGSRRNLALREFYLVTHVFGSFGEMPDRMGHLVALTSSGKLNLPIESVGLDEFAHAHDRLRAGVSVGKFVLVP
jgi:NADPH2:quinone reductase